MPNKIRPRKIGMKQRYALKRNEVLAQRKLAYISNPFPKKEENRISYAAHPSPKKAAAKKVYAAHPSPKKAAAKKASKAMYALDPSSKKGIK